MHEVPIDLWDRPLEEVLLLCCGVGSVLHCYPMTERYHKRRLGIERYQAKDKVSYHHCIALLFPIKVSFSG
jgi:hypothetical protein